MVSAAPGPAENSAGAALVHALWEISARAALHAKPQGAGARNCHLKWPVAPTTESSHAGIDGEPTEQYSGIRLRGSWL